MRRSFFTVKTWQFFLLGNLIMTVALFLLTQRQVSVQLEGILQPNFLKLVSAIFIKFLFFQQKLWKMLFISSKKPFYSWDIQIFVFLSFPLFLHVGHYFRQWSKINIEVYDVINCLNKNSVTHFVWYLEKEKRYDNETLSIDGVSDKEHLYRKITLKICSKSSSQTSL